MLSVSLANELFEFVGGLFELPLKQITMHLVVIEEGRRVHATLDLDRNEEYIRTSIKLC